MYVRNSDNRSNANNRNNFRNNGHFVRIALLAAKIFIIKMNPYRDLWEELYSYNNLFLAYKKARRHKTTKEYVIEFEKNLKDNLLLLRIELLLHSYMPKPLVNFIVRDPKTRKISKSDFRDRIVHHALFNIIEPIFDKTFIYDSYANRLTKGTLKAIERFDYFKRKISKNNTLSCYVLKADIKKYFENIDHEILLNAIERKITDNKVLRLIKLIIENHVKGNDCKKGMPLGNLTSQFFANVYLNELDYFVKHNLKVKCYIRYVDDFVILHNDKERLVKYKKQIDEFLCNNLKIGLHPEKSSIINLSKGADFLGFRVFYYHKLLKKSNIRKMKRMLEEFQGLYSSGEGGRYDKIYESFQGWLAYARHAETYKLRKKVCKSIEAYFPNEISSMEIDRWLKM